MNSGWRWYTDARALVQGLATVYNKRDETVAGVIAALSQREQWTRNVRRAEAALRAGEATGGMLQSRIKANRILAGEHPRKVLSGPKTRAFYRALLGDDNAVVIDTWMCRVYGHHEKPTPKQYKRLAQRVRREARARGIPPAVWQAIQWVEVRRGTQPNP